MRIANNLPQNGAEWLAWRKSGLGASDAPVVMGVSPYTSRFELWLEKTGLGERPDFHPMAIKAMARGTLLEPEARKHYEETVNAKFEPLNVIHEKYDFIRASLDGYNSEHNRIVEIKCPGKADLEIAKKGQVPKKYLPQVQLQLLVTGASGCDYFTYDGHNSGYIVEVLPDIAYQQELEAELVKFWMLVQTKECPLLSEADMVKCKKACETLEEKLEKARAVHQLATDNYLKQPKQETKTNDKLGSKRKRSAKGG